MRENDKGSRSLTSTAAAGNLSGLHRGNQPSPALPSFYQKRSTNMSFGDLLRQLLALLASDIYGRRRAEASAGRWSKPTVTLPLTRATRPGLTMRPDLLNRLASF